MNCNDYASQAHEGQSVRILMGPVNPEITDGSPRRQRVRSVDRHPVLANVPAQPDVANTQQIGRIAISRNFASLLRKRAGCKSL